MRLSDIRGERVFDVIADIIEPACNIAQDEEAAALFNRSEGRPEGTSPTDFVLNRIRGAVPKLMRSHREDLITILSSVEGVSREEYVSSLTMPGLMRAVYEMLTDEDLLSFLS